MEYKFLLKFMKNCDYNYMHLFGSHPFNSNPKQDEFFNGLRNDLEVVLSDYDFPWVEKAIETKFVQTTSPFDQIERLDIDDIIIFIDSHRWKDIVKHDAWLTIEQKEELKESLRDCNIARYGRINDVLGEHDFDWLPFEVKHALKANFSNLYYTNEDIIYYLKTIIWDYLFPNAFDKGRLSIIETDVRNVLKNYKENQGWYELNNFVSSMKSNYPDIDLFEISKVCASSQYQYKLHYRNPYTLGFKRLESLPLDGGSL